MLHNHTTEMVERLPEMPHRAVFNEPWRLARPDGTSLMGPYWWRIDEAGTIYRVDVATGDIRAF